MVALFTTWDRQSTRLDVQHEVQLASCERGNKVRRQIRVQNVILQNLVLASAVDAPAKLGAVLETSQQRLRDQYNSADLAQIECNLIIP